MSGHAPESEGGQPPTDPPAAVQVSHVFISYASQDVAVADGIVKALERHGLKCWIAPRDVKAGALYADAIVRAISGAKAFVLVLSESAIASSHVGKEVERASSKKRQIIALRVDAAPLTPALEYFLSESQWVEAQAGNMEAAYARVIDAIREPERTAPGIIPAATLNPLAGTAAAGRLNSVWDRVKRHKVAEWTVGYLAFGYALLQGVHLLRETFEWPTSVSRITLLVLLLGTPIAATVAWYHGHRSRQRISATELSILTVLLLITGSLLWVYAGSRSRPEGASVTRTAAVATTSPASAANVPARLAVPEKSVAVLPFVDMSEKKDQEYFADGMAEEILDLLAKIPAIKVIGRTSSFQFKGKNEDLRTIGRELGAAYVLEGSVRKAGNRVRITAQLIGTQDGVHRWSQTYDRDVVDVLKLQDEIAGGIARALQVTVGATDLQPRPVLPNPEAYDVYLQGKYAFDRADEDGFAGAADHFQQAIDIDPTFADAAAWLAYTKMMQAEFESVVPGAAFEQGSRAAEMALHLNPKLALAHVALAEKHFVYDWDWEGAEKELKQALALQPRDAIALLESAELASSLGHMDEAVRLANNSLAVDPYSPLAQFDLGYIRWHSGHLAEAETALRRCLQISPSFASGHYHIAIVL
jgi:TolB-like protein